MSSNRQPAYVKEIQEWRSDQERSLRAENGWLALADLIWLHEGQQTVGSSSEDDRRLSTSGACGSLGTFTFEGGRVLFQPNPDLEIRINHQPAQQGWLAADTDPEPSFITVGDLRIVVIKRGDQAGLRVWDHSRTERQEFPARSWYPIDFNLRLPAHFIPAGPDHKIAIPDVLGHLSEERVLGELLFEHSAKTLRLQALAAGEQHAFVIFGDQTNGDTTYPAGRFLVVELGKLEEIEVDFNKAYNPPCAFSPYATCPLPPDANRLPVRVEAGERYHSPRTHR